MRALLLSLLLCLPLAAQPLPATPPPAPAADAAPAAIAPPAREATYVWATEAVDLMRWKGDTTVLARVEPRTKLEVIFEAGDQVRVRRGTDFGWVPFAVLTSTPPPEAAAEDKSLFDTSNIQIDVGAPAGQAPAGQAPAGQAPPAP